MIGVAATSERSHRWAGAEGLAVLSSNIYQGWDYQAKLIDTYRQAWKRDERGPLDRSRIGLPIFFGIGATDEQARRDYAELLMRGAGSPPMLIPPLAKLSGDYAYMSESQPAAERAGRIGITCSMSRRARFAEARTPSSVSSRN